MMKRLIACLALLLCLAATAMAGGTEVSETVEYFNKGDFASIPGVYTYGGSKRDWIHDMAIAPDGRIAITGYTESSDGTLSDRTKTWRAGWVMMLDQNMNVMWNFCSRSGDADHMRYPVFHENGHLSVVHYTEGKQMKIVWIDENGEESLSETVMTEKTEDENISIVGVLDAGYLVCRTENYGEKQTYTLFDWEGNEIRSYDGMTVADAVGDGHLLRRTQEGLDLCAIDGGGNLTTLARAAEPENGSIKRRYDDLISLGDSGAVACGSVWEGTAPAHAQGLISRWDAQGNLVFEMIVTLGELREIVRTENGFAATCANQAEGLGTKIHWSLLEFDENGILCGSHVLEDNESLSAGGILGKRPDGMLLCAQAVGEFDEEDVIVMILEAQ